MTYSIRFQYLSAHAERPTAMLISDCAIESDAPLTIPRIGELVTLKTTGKDFEWFSGVDGASRHSARHRQRQGSTASRHAGNRWRSSSGRCSTAGHETVNPSIRSTFLKSLRAARTASSGVLLSPATCAAQRVSSIPLKVSSDFNNNLERCHASCSVLGMQ